MAARGGAACRRPLNGGQPLGRQLHCRPVAETTRDGSTTAIPTWCRRPLNGERSGCPSSSHRETRLSPRRPPGYNSPGYGQRRYGCHRIGPVVGTGRMLATRGGLRRGRRESSRGPCGDSGRSLGVVVRAGGGRAGRPRPRHAGGRLSAGRAGRRVDRRPGPLHPPAAGAISGRGIVRSGHARTRFSANDSSC